MAVRIAEFIAVVLAALALVPVGSHLAALPNKIDLPADAYLTVQHVYDGWAWFGIIDVAAIVAAAVLAILLRGGGLPFWLASAGCLLLLVSLAVFFAMVFPGNAATHDWTELPDNWRSLRSNWETGHATEAILTFFGFVAILAAVIVGQPPGKLT